MPQGPWGKDKEVYFPRALQTTPAIIRNSEFMWYYYRTFKPSMWVLFEVAVYIFTCEREHPDSEDAKKLTDHVQEMYQIGVRPTLSKHGYRCRFDRDDDFFTAWLEILVPLRKLFIDVDDMRWILDRLTLISGPGQMFMNTSTV